MTQDKDDANVLSQEQGSTGNQSSYKEFFAFRVIAGIAFGVIVLWGSWIMLSHFEQPRKPSVADIEEDGVDHGVEEDDHGAHDVADTPSTPEHDFAQEHDTSAEHEASHESVPPHEPKALESTL